MKNITNQYQDLLEGKMSKDNFMRNVRMDFPQWISPVNSFTDAVNILKSKRVLSEGIHDLNITSGKGIAGYVDSNKMADNYSKSIRRSNTTNDDDEFDDMEKRDNMEKAAEDAKLSQWDYMGEGSAQITSEAIEVALKNMWEEGLIDTVTWKTASKALPNFDIDGNMNMVGTTTADDLARELVFVATGNQVPDIVDYDDEEYNIAAADDFNINMRVDQERENRFSENKSLNEAIVHEFDRVNYIQLMKGMEFELLQMPEVTDLNLIKAKVKAYKNLVKDPKAYMELIITNTDAVEKIDKGLRTQEVKKDNLVDKVNAMKVLKKNEKANTQTNQSNKERAKGLPKGVKIVKESVAQRLKENILEEYFEIGEPKKKFTKGESVVTPEGEIGVIEEMTPDNTAEIKLSSGKVVHRQGNVLKPHVEKHVDEYKDNTGFERWSSEKRGKELAAAEIKQADNKAGETFNVGDVVVAPDGKEVKITGFMKGKDDRMKAMYNAGMYSDVYDLDALEKKNSFRSGVDLGKSFNKFKSLKEKLVKVLKEKMKEGAVATTEKGGFTVASGLNPSDVLKTAKELEKKTGDQITVVDMKTGKTTKA